MNEQHKSYGGTLLYFCSLLILCLLLILLASLREDPTKIKRKEDKIDKPINHHNQYLKTIEARDLRPGWKPIHKPK